MEPNTGSAGLDPSVPGDGNVANTSSQPPGANSTPCLNDYCVSMDDYVALVEKYIFPTPFEWVLIGLYIVVFTVGLAGNFLVCFAVSRNQHMRTVTNLFIVNLAVADFLVILICLPPTVLGDVTETWYMGAILCKIIQYLQVYTPCWRDVMASQAPIKLILFTLCTGLPIALSSPSLQGVSVSVSVLTLSVISIERWYAICQPLKFKSTPTRARVMIIVIWLLAMLMLIPELVVLDTYRHHTLPPELTTLLTSCRPKWGYDSQATYEFFKMVALYIVPCCLMGYTYGQIVRCLWSNAIPTATISSSSCNSRSAIKTGLEYQLTARRKAAKMLIAVFTMFAVCYLPVHLLNILRYAKALPDSQWTTNFALLAHYMCYFNSAINPVIYNFMSVKFRKEFRKMCVCCTVTCPCEDRVRTRRLFDGKSVYTYKYTNDLSQTEQLTMTTIRPNMDTKADDTDADL